MIGLVDRRKIPLLYPRPLHLRHCSVNILCYIAVDVVVVIIIDITTVVVVVAVVIIVIITIIIIIIIIIVVNIVVFHYVP